MGHTPGRPKKPAVSHPFTDPKEIGLRAVEHLQSEVRRIYADIDQQHWSPSQKIAPSQQIIGVFGAWFLALPHLIKGIKPSDAARLIEE